MTSDLSQGAAHSRGFARLALWAALVTLAMIVIGAVTRVTESGMGCGPYWPSCNGHIIPEFYDMTVVIEFGHRLFALVVGVFTALVGIRAWRQFRDTPMVFTPSMIAVALFFVQSGLGAVTVALYNQWVSVMLHLAVAMFLLAAFLVAWVNARYVEARSPDALVGSAQARIVLPPTEVFLATALSFVVAMIGAAVAGTNATRACIGWPLCDGAVWPADQGPLQMLHMLHRLVVGGLGLLLLLMVFQARAGVGKLMWQALMAAGALFLIQSALGALIVLVDSRELLTAVRAVHVLFAASTWAAMVVASTVAWLQLLPNVERKTLPVGVSSATTSS